MAIIAEAGFDPTTEVDVASLFFGAPASVDFGKGSKAVKSETRGKDLVVTCDAASTGFRTENFGLATSQPTPMETMVRNAAGTEHVVTSTIRPIAPYEGVCITVPLPAGFLEPGTKGSVRTVITPAGSRPVELRSSVEVPK